MHKNGNLCSNIKTVTARWDSNLVEVSFQLLQPSSKQMEITAFGKSMQHLAEHFAAVLQVCIVRP